LGDLHGMAEMLLLQCLEESESCSGLKVSQLLNHLRHLLNPLSHCLTLNSFARFWLLINTLPLPYLAGHLKSRHFFSRSLCHARDLRPKV
jgi:hypothetical protein